MWDKTVSKGALVVKSADAEGTAYWIVAGTNRALPTSFFAAAGEEFKSFDDLLSVLKTAPEGVTVMIGDSKMFEIDDNMQFREFSREELRQIDDALGENSTAD